MTFPSTKQSNVNPKPAHKHHFLVHCIDLTRRCRERPRRIFCSGRDLFFFFSFFYTHINDTHKTDCVGNMKNKIEHFKVKRNKIHRSSIPFSIAVKPLFCKRHSCLQKIHRFLSTKSISQQTIQHISQSLKFKNKVEKS